VRFDQVDAVSKPFEILKGGYQIIFQNGKWSQIFGSAKKKKEFAKEDRRQHRSEERKLKKLKKSARSNARRAA
jgi:hypothetical protein